MEQDRVKLTTFLNDVQELLLEDIQRNLDPGLKRHAEAAWPQLVRRFDALREALRDPSYDDALERVGLTGAELDLKLFAFNRAAGIHAQQERQGGLWQRTKRFFGGIFGWFGKKWRSFAGVILSSLAEALGLAEPLREAVEVFGLSLE
jgi:hypothetical protein